jgi:CheY-like chemotaxis protein
VPGESAIRPLVLVVDDEALLLRAWRRLLSGLPIRLRACSDARAALEAITAEVPDLVVSDHHMPGTSGLDLLASIREEHPATEVVLVTTDSLVLRQAASQGIRVFDKSSPPEELKTLVAALVEARRRPRGD